MKKVMDCNKCGRETKVHQDLLCAKCRRYRPLAVRQAQAAAILRDGKCLDCGATEKLTGHHVIHYSVDKSLGSDLSNIRTLCHACHYKAHPEMAWAFKAKK